MPSLVRCFSTILIGLYFLLFSPPLLGAAKKCKKVTEVTLVHIAKIPRTDIFNLPKFRVPRELLETSKLYHPKEPPTLALGLKAMKERFEKAAQDRLGLKDAEELKNILAAMRFIDYVHLAPSLVEIFSKAKPGSLLNSKLHTLYDQEPNTTVFQFAEEARVFLKNTSLPPGLERLIKVQKITMQNGVEGLTKKDLGVVRSVAVYGAQEQPFTKNAIKTIENNPYLQFVETTRAGDSVYGEIHYPSIENVKKEALDRIRNADPSLCNRIEAIQKSGVKPDSNQQARLTRDLVTALAKERYDFFNQQSEKLRDRLTDIATLHAYIKLVAEHFRDMISIHPLVNGNGRSVRFESLYDPLDKIGIPRPRLNNPDRDILASPSQWVDEVERGIWSNYFLYKDLTMRLELGLPLENSSELLSPQLSYAVGILEKNPNKKVVEKSLELVPLDSSQFSAFLKLRFRQEPSLVAAMKLDPLVIQKQLKDEFKVFVRDRRFRYKNSKESQAEYISQYLIDPDFYFSFGQVWATQASRWQAKMDRWFRRDSLVWRGLPYGERKLSDEDIFAMFNRLSDHSIAVNLVKSFPESPVSFREFASAKKSVLGEFDRFNEAVFLGKLSDIIQDHISEGANYDISYGYSTSKNWGTGQKYAWKREPNITQGETEWVVHDGTKVILGAYPTQHDVDLSRLKVIDGDFSYQANKGDHVVNVNRQKEVLGIGAADPDSVMIVQILSDTGRVLYTYARNSENPREIWKIKGRYSAEDHSAPPLEKIEKTFYLSEE